MLLAFSAYDTIGVPSIRFERVASLLERTVFRLYVVMVHAVVASNNPRGVFKFPVCHYAPRVDQIVEPDVVISPE